MKRYKKIILLTVLFVFTLAAAMYFSACGGKSVTAVSIGRNDMPRLEYVQGQSLDLSAGKLTVEFSDGTVETIPLNSADLTVSGFDGEKVGKQTVTVSYKEQATTFEVSVIARMAVQNPQTVYYVGESLDTSKGSLAVANEDATTFSVLFSDEAVSFKGFDSSKPTTKQTITVVYSANGKEYEASFDIAVYSTENAKLTPFIKTSYFSHEKFRVNGAYITYSNGNPSQNKNIPVTEDMISGIDFTLVTEENSPLEQTGKVTYGGREYPFTITITYSDVTRLQKMLGEYDFSWTEPTVPEISEEQGKNAEKCVNLYLTLSSTERDYVDKENIEAAVRTAAAYSFGVWSESLKSLEKSFSVDGEKVVYRLESFLSTKTDALVVADDSAPVNAELALISDIADEFGDLMIGGVKMSEYLSDAVIYAENRTLVNELMAFTVELYETLADVPDTWEDLTAYGAKIDMAKKLVTEGQFGSASYRNIFAQVSYWRVNDDFFDIVYSYYLQKEDNDSINALKNIILPSKLNALYENIVSAMLESSAIYPGTEDGQSTDSTFLVYYYQQACDLLREIKQSGNELHLKLYETLTFDDLLATAEGDPLPATFDDLIDFIKITPFGYYDLIGSTLDDGALISLWKNYLDLLDAATQEEVGVKIKTLLDGFVVLSPAQQKNFLFSVNVYYYDYEKPALDLDTSYTYFVRAINAYYSEILSEKEFDMLRNLLLAIESYAGVSDKSASVKDFLYYLSEVTKAYNGLQDKTAFETNFGAYYEKYLSIAELYNEDGALKESFEIGEEWQAVFDSLVKEIENMLYADSLIWESDESLKQEDYIRLFASYENARRIAESILTTAPENVKAAYYHDLVAFGKDNEWTLDYAMSMQAAGLGVMSYNLLVFSDVPLWEVVGGDAVLREFMANASAILWSDDASETVADETETADIMKQFLTFSDAQKVIFLQLQAIDENHQYYYEGISEIFKRVFAGKENLIAAVDALLNAESSVINYRYVQSEGTEEDISIAKDELDANMNALYEALTALDAEESALYNSYFEEIVTYYQDAYTAI